MAININRVVLTGNLTKDPELRALPSGTSVCELRLACNGRRKSDDGTWAEKPNYFTVKVWGGQADAAGRYLSKGSPVAIDGCLEWREWDAKDDGGKRQAVEIVAESVQFLPDGKNRPEEADQESDFQPAPTGGDDDIPF
jgi:single-strand DNA-binding protein